MLFSICGLGLTTAGCVWATKTEVRSNYKQHETRLSRLEKGLETDVSEAKVKLEELEALLERATRAVTRNSADLGVEVDALRRDFQGMQGSIAEIRRDLDQLLTRSGATDGLEQRLQRLEKQSGVELDVKEEPNIPADKAAHFAAAQKAYQGGDLAVARRLYREYVRRYARDAQADDAQYWLGMSFLDQNKPATALGEFRKVIEDYAKEDAVDDALIGMAEAFWQLRACSDAQSALNTLIRNHARSKLVTKAKQKLQEIKRAPKSRCTS